MRKQMKVVAQDAIVGSEHVNEIALFDSNGDPVDLDSANGGSVAYTAVVSGSAIGTVGKTTSADEPAAGTVVMLKLTNGNSANSPTVAFNGATARAIQLGGAAVTGAKCTVAAGGVVPLWFDGTVLHMFGTIA